MEIVEVDRWYSADNGVKKNERNKEEKGCEGCFLNGKFDVNRGKLMYFGMNMSVSWFYAQNTMWYQELL